MTNKFVHIDASLSALGTSAPEPLRALSVAVVSKENIAILEQRNALRPLGWWERLKLRLKQRQIERQLAQNASFLKEVKQHLAEIDALEEQLIPLVAEQEEQATPERASLITKLEKRLGLLKGVYTQVIQVRHMPLKQLEDQFNAINLRLSEHVTAVKLQAAQKKIYQMLQQEALDYLQIIQSSLTALNYCFRWIDQNGDPHVHPVLFDQICAGVDAHYFRVDTTFRNWRGNWQTHLPRGVEVVKLMSDATATQLGAVCKRKVQTRFSELYGAWYVVNRHDSSDGILEYVTYEEMQERLPAGRLVCPVGVGENRATEYVDLTEHPHGLIAGMSGTGKSNFINVVIGTLLMHPPREVKLVLIDMKGNVEFGFYEGLPHLHGEICSDLGAVARRLDELEWLMADRQTKLRLAHCKNIDQYNAARSKAGRWPHIFCVIDEAASLTSSTNKGINGKIMSSLEEIARKGRASGIHLYICTQRPDAKVFSGQIQNNMDWKVVFRMARIFDSMTALGGGEAQVIPDIKGRAIVRKEGRDTPLQTPFISNETLTRLIENAKNHEPYALPIPDEASVLHHELTALEVAQTMIEHAGGNVAYSHIYSMFKEEITQREARKFTEEIEKMFKGKGKEVLINGKAYRMAKNGRQRALVLVKEGENDAEAD